MSMPLTVTLALDPLSTTLMLMGLALLATIIFVNLRRKRSGSDENLTPHERLERNKQLGGTRNDLRTMMVELEELTRRFSAQLDNKSTRLEQLIKEADERIEQLNRAGTSSSSPDPREAASSNGSADDPPAEPDDPLTRDVYRLADDGNDATEIARQLDEHIGKVELILALRQK